MPPFPYGVNEAVPQNTDIIGLDKNEVNGTMTRADSVLIQPVGTNFAR